MRKISTAEMRALDAGSVKFYLGQYTVEFGCFELTGDSNFLLTCYKTSNSLESLFRFAYDKTNGFSFAINPNLFPEETPE